MSHFIFVYLFFIIIFVLRKVFVFFVFLFFFGDKNIKQLDICKMGFVAVCVPQIIQNNQMTLVSVLSVTHLITICLIVTH